MISVVFIFIVLLMCTLFYYQHDVVNDDDFICGTIETDIERSIFLKKPPFTPGQTVNVHVTDVHNTGGQFKQHIVDVVTAEVAPFVNVKFVFVESKTPSASGALVTVTNDSSTSGGFKVNGQVTGMGTKTPRVLIGQNTPDRTVIHEFGHVLGLAHEHLNPDFAKSKKLDFEKMVARYMKSNNVDREAATKKIMYQNFTKRDEKKYSYTPLYDPDSVMLYTFNANVTTDGVKIVGGQVFSELDKAQLHKMYTAAPQLAQAVKKKKYKVGRGK